MTGAGSHQTDLFAGIVFYVEYQNADDPSVIDIPRADGSITFTTYDPEGSGMVAGEFEIVVEGDQAQGPNTLEATAQFECTR